MPGRRAKILSSFDVGDLLIFASCTRHPLRNAVMVLLSAKAGLRAGEIANSDPPGSGCGVDGVAARMPFLRLCDRIRTRRPDAAAQHRRVV